MARIPTFQNRAGVNTGAGFMRFQSASAMAAPGKALARLGSQITGVGEDILKADMQINAVAERQAEKDYGLQKEDVLLDYDREMNEYLAETQANAGPGAPGYTNDFQAHAEQRAKEIIAERFPGRENDKELQNRFERARQGYVKTAAKYEWDRRVEWRDGVLGKKLESLSSTIGMEVGQVVAANKALLQAYGPDDDVDPPLAAAQQIYTAKAQEWDRVIQEQFGDQPAMYAVAKERGMAAIDRSYLASVAAVDKKEFITKLNGAYTGMPAENADKRFVTIHDAFTTHGLDPKWGGAIFGIESDFGKVPYLKDVPRRKDGTPMSSATGEWQIMRGTADDIGIPRSERNNFEVATPAIAAHLAKNAKDLAANKLPVTAATTYMTWNIGPHATKSLLRANPNANANQVLMQAWRGLSPKNRYNHMRNNPTFYGPTKPNATVGQVLANYDREIARRMKQAEPMWTGVDSDSKARSAVAGYFPEGGGTALTGKDIGDVFEKVAVDYKTEQKDVALDQRFNATWEGRQIAEPSDPTYQKSVDKNVGGLFDPELIASGDIGVHSQIVNVTSKTRYVPEDMARTLSDTVLSKGIENPGKAVSYLTMARIADDYPEAWKNSKFDGEVKERVADFVANVDVLRLPQAEAIKRVEYAFSPDGKKEMAAMKERVAAELKNGKKGILKGRDETWNKIEAHFDTAWDFANFETSAVQKDLAIDAYENAYIYHRAQGRNEEQAGIRALKDMERGWGVTKIDGQARLSPAPVELNYPAVGQTGHQWVVEEATNHVKAYLSERGLYPSTPEEEVLMRAKGEGDAILNPKISIVATPETMDDIRNGKQAPRYKIRFKRPDGMHDAVPGLVQFDYQTARAVQIEKDIAGGGDRKRVGPNYFTIEEY